MDDPKPTRFSDLPWYLQILTTLILIGGAWITYSVFSQKPDPETTAACADSVNDPDFSQPEKACDACCYRQHATPRGRGGWFGFTKGPFVCTCLK